MTAFINYLFGPPLLNPDLILSAVLDQGSITKSTTEKIVVEDSDGNKIVFTGTFDPEGTGSDGLGTMTGFKLRDDGVKVMEAGGFDIDAGALLDALADLDSPIAAVAQLLFTEKVKINGSDYADTFAISLPDIVANGRKGADILLGGIGNQTLKGGKGDDLIVGGGDKDKLFGGKDQDIFGFNVPTLSPNGIESLDPASGHHRIKDFSRKDDSFLIDSDSVDLPEGRLAKKHFVVGEEALTEDHRFVHNDANGRLYYDPDGSGEDEPFYLAKVDPGIKIKANDIFIGDVPNLIFLG
ncbi:hypothetical protein [Bauldia sp.]|uniref:hypothetical protein n=1 Tax=Bauldia sp. TaxID=2575872 RepID=UPI003BAD3C3B